MGGREGLLWWGWWLFSLYVHREKNAGVPGWLSRVGVRLLVSAQVMISQLRGFKPRIGLCAGSREPAWDSLSLSFSAHPPHALSLSLSK